MPRQTFIWTALPNGVEKLPGRGQPRLMLRLSVFVTPRLHDDLDAAGRAPRRLRLGDFPDLGDWPGTLSRITQNRAFIVRLDGVPLPAVELALPSLTEGTELWGALFPPGTPVDPFEFDDFSSSQTQTYPASALAERIREGYVDGVHPTAGGGVDLLSVVGLLQRTIFQHLPQLPLGVPRIPGVPGLPVIPIVPGLVGSLGGQLPGVIGPPTPGLPGVPRIPVPPVVIGPPPPGGVGPGIPPVIVGPPLPRLPVDPRLLTQFFDFHRPPPGDPPKPPTERDLKDLLDFHQMVSLLGDHPAVLRSLGLIVDIRVPLPPDLLGALLPVRSIRVEPIWVPMPVSPTDPLAKPVRTVNHSPQTACTLKQDLFLPASRPQDPETNDGLLRLDDPVYHIEQFDIDGAVFKLQGQQAGVTTVAAGLSPTMPNGVGLPALRTSGISVLREDLDAQLQKKHQEAAKRNQLLEVAERIGIDPTPGEPLFAEDVSVGYRADVWDDVSKKWHSLHFRQVTYTVPPPTSAKGPGSAPDEGYVELTATERPLVVDPKSPPPPRTLFVSPSIFTWEGWGLSAPRPGLHITNPDPSNPDPSKRDETAVEMKNDRAFTGLNLTTKTVPVGGTLPRLRIGRTYRFRARMVDLAGNSRPLFQDQPDTIPEATREFPFCRFEPVASPPVVLAHAPREGESVERLVCRSDPGDPTGSDLSGLPQEIDHRTAERHLVPPKVSQLLAELHGMFDDPSSGTMRGDAPTHGEIAKRDRATLQDPGLPGIEFVREDLEGHQVTPPMVVHPVGQLRVPYLPDPMAHGVLLVGLPGAKRTTMPDGKLEALTHIPFQGSWPDIQAVRVHLQAPAGKAPAAPRFDKANNTLVVELAGAETATIRLSCHLFPPPAPDAAPRAAMTKLRTMGVWRWIEQLAPAEQQDRLRREALQGRNWLLMPYREIVLVHAVQRPIEPPVPLPRDLVIGRAPASTYATVDSVIQVHGPSTAKVDLLAQWSDCIDDPDANEPAEVSQHSHLGSRDVKVDDPQVRMPTAKQFFGDTKHHLVTYSATATTRFREYFNTDAGGVRRVFARQTPVDQRIVRDVPSSTRPQPPRVLYAVPIFTWDRERPGTSTRTARGVRVYMARPWYSSGNDEKLAVVFVPGGPLPDSDPRKPLCTMFAADPVWDAPVPAVPDLNEKVFVSANAVVRDLSLEELPGGQRVTAAVFGVGFERERRLWFCDIRFATTSHFPFVRLALARFQPFSLAGVELSRVATTDFVQLPPDRSATVTELSNAGGQKRRGFRVSGVVARHTGGGAGTTKVSSRLEVKVLKQRDASLDWVLESTTVATTFTDNGPTRTWEGTVAYDDDKKRRRLLIEEFEEYKRS